MSGLSQGDLDRLVGVLGMLGSDHDGERAAAGLKAHNMLAKRGLTWRGLLAPVDSNPVADNPKASRRAMYPERGEPPERTELTADHQRRALMLLHSATPWSAKDRGFLESMSRQRGKPSQPQADWLADLATKARRHRAEREGIAA